jgi:hypothetical protein
MKQRDQINVVAGVEHYNLHFRVVCSHCPNSAHDSEAWLSCIDQHGVRVNPYHLSFRLARASGFCRYLKHRVALKNPSHRLAGKRAGAKDEHSDPARLWHGHTLLRF